MSSNEVSPLKIIKELILHVNYLKVRRFLLIEKNSYINNIIEEVKAMINMNKMK